PLTTSATVKQAMLRDAGSWHYEFNAVVKSVRERLLALAGFSPGAGWEAILLQGSGTFGVEAVLATTIPPSGKVLILTNGAYGERIVQMAQYLKIAHAVLRTPEDTPPQPADVERTLAADSSITHVACVHCETTTGILNPITEVGRVVKQHRRVYIVDAMSSFAAVPIDFAAAGIDYLISSANKCVEGVPGFSFVICRRADLIATEGFARSLSLDLLAQLKGFDKNGQFRYTPPTHVILAFDQALKELEQEGGVLARAARYRRNHEVLVTGMQQLGFRLYLNPKVQSYIITGFHYPSDPKFSFDEFYRRLSDKAFIIYPGKLTQVNTFRIGTIGRIFESDIRSLLAAIRETLDEMNAKAPPT
ncbi:MAG: 2-aminoethylphosphonate--pyruvate transaminase, partial [Verrucomicrobia subdivision 3 bacterium]|nr:2-aminoethylphosphonate--pyruvate transaminase [Limisphaerales bacterium]